MIGVFIALTIFVIVGMFKADCISKVQWQTDGLFRSNDVIGWKTRCPSTSYKLFKKVKISLYLKSQILWKLY